MDEGVKLSIGYNNAQGFGLVKQELMKKLLDEEKMDIVALTETKRNDDHPVSNLHHNYNWIGKNRSNGRGGGIGFIYNSKSISVIDDNLLNSKADNRERMWISIKCDQAVIAIGVVYCPVDNVSSTYEEAEQLHNELLQNIGELESQFARILLLGDFNGKASAFKAPNKLSSNGALLDNMVEATEFVLLNSTDKCTGSVTWSRGAQSSTIDYALCNVNMYDNIESISIDENQKCSIGSDHNFILIQAKFSTSDTLVDPPPANVQKWNITDNTNWAKFEAAVCDEFEGWQRDTFANVDDMWHNFKSRIVSAGAQTVGFKTYNNKKVFWDKEVDKLIHDRRQANRLYRVWSNHPNCSPDLLSLLWEDYLQKKRSVADKVKSNMIKHKTKVITQNASKASHNPKAFWNFLSKFNKTSNYPLKIRHPEHPDLVIDDPLVIKKTLTSYWSGLGNGKPSDVTVKEKLASLGTQCPLPDSLHSIAINIDLVEFAVAKLRNGKATGKDSIPGEFLKNGGQVLSNALLDLFSTIMLCEKLPEEWYEGIVKPLFKDGNRENLNNYRGITISSILYKTLVMIIENQTMDYVESKNLLKEYQGAFRKDRRCEDHIFSLKGICSIRKSRKCKTYLGFLDISKAFDKVNREMLFTHLWECGVQGKAWNLIRMLYARVDNKVIFGKFESDIYEVTNGLKQGCNLSPCLFNLVVTDLDSMLEDHEGVNFGDHTIRGLYYADDIVLLAHNEQSLQAMLNTTDCFAKKWGLAFNDTKSQVLVIGAKFNNKQWSLGEKSIKETRFYKYLGIIIDRHLKDSVHINDYIAKKAKNLESYTRFTLAKHMDVNRVHFGNTIWQSAVQPSLLHASGVWFNKSKQSTNKLKSLQYKMAKAVLKIKCNPATSSTLGDLGWLPISDQMNINRIAYFNHIQQMSCHRLPKIVYQELQKLYDTNVKTPFNYLGFIKSIFEEKGLDFMFNEPERCCVRTYKRLTYSCYGYSFYRDIDSHSSLKYYKHIKQNTFCSEYLMSKFPFKNTQIKFKIRNGVSGLGEDLHRQQRDNGLCKHCGSFESLKHYLFHCDAYNSARKTMYQSIKQTSTEDFNVFIRDPDYAICKLLGDHDDHFNQYMMDYINVTWNIRKNF